MRQRDVKKKFRQALERAGMFGELVLSERLKVNRRDHHAAVRDAIEGVEAMLGVEMERHLPKVIRVIRMREIKK